MRVHEALVERLMGAARYIIHTDPEDDREDAVTPHTTPVCLHPEKHLTETDSWVHPLGGGLGWFDDELGCWVDLNTEYDCQCGERFTRKDRRVVIVEGELQPEEYGKL